MKQFSKKIYVELKGPASGAGLFLVDVELSGYTYIKKLHAAAEHVVRVGEFWKIVAVSRQNGE